MLISCNSNNPDYIEDDGDMLLVLKISPVRSGSSLSMSDPVESIKSLRIIMIADGRFIEINEKMDLYREDYAASDFSYVFTKRTPVGKKQLFFIANEESFKNIKLTSDNDFPTDMPKNSLTDLLDYFVAEELPDINNSNNSEPGNNTTDNFSLGDTFIEVLNSIYFENDYSSIINDGLIYLPYSAYYELELHKDAYGNGEAINRIEKPMYIVPAAVKFDFTFTNFRKNDVTIEDIIVSSVNQNNYLHAQLEDPYISLSGEKVWWVDWLEACAQASASADNNVEFNNIWGWIDNYSLPIEEEETKEIALNQEEEIWNVKALTDKNNPLSLKLGPYYFPESQNMVEKEVYNSATNQIEKILVQSYFLQFNLHDTMVETVTQIKDNEISNLMAFFRGTYIHIYVDLYESQVEIYAEMADWNPVRFQGFVKEDED